MPTAQAFIRGKSSQIELPERVDVVICDHVGYFGFDYGVVEFFADARKRFLKPGGTLIPSSIRLNIAAVGAQRCDELANGWSAEGIPEEFHWLRKHAVNTKHAVNLERGDVLAAPAVLGDIDLHADNPEFFSWNAELRIERDGLMHGLAGWFECELAEGVWMTNSPLAEAPIRRPQAFLPIDEAVQVKAGDTVRATVMARPADHLIAWVVEFPASGQRFAHSTWQGQIDDAGAVDAAQSGACAASGAQGASDSDGPWLLRWPADGCGDRTGGSARPSRPVSFRGRNIRFCCKDSGP